MLSLSIPLEVAEDLLKTLPRLVNNSELENQSPAVNFLLDSLAESIARREAEAAGKEYLLNDSSSY